MSYLGANGKIMEGSGLTDALQTCYGSIAVSHMITRKAESKAVRGRMLADAALHILLVKAMRDTYLSKNEIDQLKDPYNSMLLNSSVPAEDEALMPECVQKLHDLLVDYKVKLGQQS